MFGPDGEILRDIDIDELIISVGRPVGSRIVLTKNEVTYQKTISGGIYPDFFEQKKIKITKEQFKELSDAIHDAGLLNVVSPNVEIFKEEEIALGYISTEYMICFFDDGVKAACRVNEHNWNTEFHAISRILKEIYTPIAISPHIRPSATAPGKEFKKAILFPQIYFVIVIPRVLQRPSLKVVEGSRVLISISFGAFLPRRISAAILPVSTPS
jgi:hypothetical protein